MSFVALYNNRADSTGKPTLWAVPGNLKQTPFVTRHDAQPVDVAPTISRLIAAGLCLELDVGMYVNEEYKRLNLDNPHPEIQALKKLLVRNIQDETRHYAGFQALETLYPVSSSVMDEAQALATKWETSEFSPLEKAYYLEVGVFLTSLGIARFIGGDSFEKIAAGVSFDEQDHVKTNRNTLRNIVKTSVIPSQRIQALVYETLEFLFGDLNVQSPYGTIDLAFCKTCSDDLIATGKSYVLTKLNNFLVYRPNFETSNGGKSYGREVES